MTDDKLLEYESLAAGPAPEERDGYAYTFADLETLNREWIVAARTALAELVAEVRRLQGVIGNTLALLE